MLQDAWAVVVSALVVCVPGVVVLLAAHLRGWVLVASPLVTYGLATGGGALLSALAIPWTPLTFFTLTIVVALIVWLMSRFIPRLVAPVETPPWREPLSRAAHIAVAACATVGGLFGALTMRRGMGSFSAINQDWDAVFHAAVVRWVVEFQDMSQHSLAQLNNRESVETFYYPNAWHGVSALGWSLGVDSVPRLLDSGMALVPFLLAFGIAALVLRFTRSAVAAGAAGLLVSMPSALVFDPLWRGPLIPFAVGLALTPAFVLLVDRALNDRRVVALAVTGLAAAGVFGLHPSGVYTAVLFLAPWLVQRWLSDRKLILKDLVGVGVVIVIAVGVAAPVVSAAFAADTGQMQDWPTSQTAGQAIGDALLLNHARPTPQWAIALLALVGVLYVRRFRDLWWFWASGAMALGLFVGAAAYSYELTERLTSPWWNDAWRFAAMVALFVVVLAAIGFAGIVDRVGTWLADRTPFGPRAATIAVGIVTALVFLVMSRAGYLNQNTVRASWNYSPVAGTVADDDRALWAQAARIVPEGQFVLNDPSDGSPWMFAMEGIRPYFGGMTVAIAGQQGLTPDQEALLFHLDEIATNQDVQRIVEEADAHFVIVGPGRIHGLSVAPGFDNLEGNPAFKLVTSVGEARLYEIVG